jgi:hypothetical protein
MTTGITLSGDQVDIITLAVKALIDTARDQKPSGERKMAVKQQRAIWSACQEISGNLEDASSRRRHLEFLMHNPNGMVDIHTMWGGQS